MVFINTITTIFGTPDELRTRMIFLSRDFHAAYTYDFVYRHFVWFAVWNMFSPYRFDLGGRSMFSTHLAIISI